MHCNPTGICFLFRLELGGETLPPIISADFSTIVAALERTSNGFSDSSEIMLLLAVDCTWVLEVSATDVVIP